MKVEELRSLSDEELLEKEKELRKELFNLRFQKAINQLENPMRMREVRRTIARIKTILRERELEKERGTVHGENQ